MNYKMVNCLSQIFCREASEVYKTENVHYSSQLGPDIFPSGSNSGAPSVKQTEQLQLQVHSYITANLFHSTSLIAVQPLKARAGPGGRTIC